MAELSSNFMYSGEIEFSTHSVVLSGQIWMIVMDQEQLRPAQTAPVARHTHTRDEQKLAKLSELIMR